jgi:phytoene dehydrogenase-like protein
MTNTSRAVVVGSGPNGLAAAVVLAQAGLSVTVLEAHDEIGGGTRSAELTVPGLVHDVCSASHPFGAASPLFARLRLDRYGLEWRRAPIEVVHPLDGGRAGVLYDSLESTAEGLGIDARRWRRVFGPLTRGFDELADDVLAPIVGVPSHPVKFARFALRAGLPASLLARAFSTDEAQSLFAGSAAHIMRPLRGLATSSVGVMLTTAAHVVGWPVAVGGSRSVTRALGDLLEELGGTIQTGVTVRTAADLPPAEVTMFDTSPAAVAEILARRLPRSSSRSLRRWKHGPGAFKLDLAVQGGIPWTHAQGRRAGLLHLGGDLCEMERTESEVAAGQMPERPFVLVAQQYLADPQRSVGDVHPIWAYAHVPAGYAGDASESIIAQIERFAPGVRDRIVARRAMSPADLSSYNANYRGGDILTGANTLRQLVLRPKAGRHPYSVGLAGHYLCSAATPPGAGVHGMCGLRAAEAALADLA